MLEMAFCTFFFAFALKNNEVNFIYFSLIYCIFKINLEDTCIRFEKY